MILINRLSVSFRATLAHVVRVAFIVCVLLSREREKRSERDDHSFCCGAVLPSLKIHLLCQTKLSIVIKDFSGWLVREIVSDCE